jgi:regulator of protease activity HflC (stomatin/prohibitin superfamily)
MTAERTKRASIAESEGAKQSMINRAEGQKQEQVALSEGEKIKRINEAEGRAQEILLVADATASGLEKVSAILDTTGGEKAANLEVAKKYIIAFEALAKESTTMIVPSDVSDVSKMVAVAMNASKIGSLTS